MELRRSVHATRTVCGPASSSREARPAMSKWATSARNHQLPRPGRTKPRGRPVSECGPAQTGSGARFCSRNAARDRASRRDTCICDIPSRPAIWVWVMFSKKRSRRTFCSRSGSAANRGRTVATSSTLSRFASTSPMVFVTDRSSSSSFPPSERQTTGWNRPWMQSPPPRPHPGLCPTFPRFRWRWARAPTDGTAPRERSSVA